MSFGIYKDTRPRFTLAFKNCFFLLVVKVLLQESSSCAIQRGAPGLPWKRKRELQKNVPGTISEMEQQNWSKLWFIHSFSTALVAVWDDELTKLVSIQVECVTYNSGSRVGNL